MATINGSFSKNNNNLSIYIVYDYTQNIAGNYSTVTAKLYVKRLTSYATTNSSSIAKYITINGQKTSGTGFDIRNTSVGSSLLCLTATEKINHNSDGTKKISIVGYLGTGSFNPGTGNVNGSVTLKTIPRVTSFTVSGTKQFGSTVTFNYSMNSSLRATFRYAYSGGSGTIVSKTANTSSYSWTIPASFINNITTSESDKITIYCDTYSGDTKLGTYTQEITVAVPSSYVPTISSTSISRNDSVASSYYFAGKSRVDVTVNFAKSAGSPITDVCVVADGKTTSKSVSSTATSATVTSAYMSSGSKPITVYVLDARGRRSAVTTAATVTVSYYNQPQITQLSYTRVNASGAEDKKGTIAKITMKAVFTTNVPGQTRKLKYKTTSSSSWTTVALSNQDYAPYTLSGLNGASAYDIQFEISDGYTSSIKKSAQIANATTLVCWNGIADGISFGTDSVTSNVFRVAGLLKAEINNLEAATLKATGTTTLATANVTTLNATTLKATGTTTLATANVTTLEAATLKATGTTTLNTANITTTNTTNLKVDGKSVSEGLLNSVYSSSDSYIYLGKFMIAYGSIEFTGLSGNVTKTITKTFRTPFGNPPAVVCSLNTAVAEKIDVGVNSVTSTACNFNLIRTNSTDTTIFWVAMGFRA